LVQTHYVPERRETMKYLILALVAGVAILLLYFWDKCPEKGWHTWQKIDDNIETGFILVKCVKCQTTKKVPDYSGIPIAPWNF
jgi:hypothetical protein